jgi:hypothetical protein
MRRRSLDNDTNLLGLPRDYLCLAVVIGGAGFSAERRHDWGLPGLCIHPVSLTAINLIGAVRHHLAGLGPEASHDTFMKNRFLRGGPESPGAKDITN